MKNLRLKKRFFDYLFLAAVLLVLAIGFWSPSSLAGGINGIISPAVSSVRQIIGHDKKSYEQESEIPPHNLSDIRGAYYKPLWVQPFASSWY
ncbi:MAG: hypothetical protein A2X49_04960 [Lentisphaerae bacterium GWF2_52_8]|nr:MAG: hypothetical protein A2X49_04960 [Lentisphaerae bacterium GWF2_52_8]